MKIAYIYTGLLTIGGADRVLTDKANYFADKMNFDVFIITDSQGKNPPIFPLSPKVQLIDLDINFDEEYHYKLVGRALCYIRLMKKYKKRLSKALNEIKPDIVLSLCGREMDFLTDIKDGSIKIGESHIARNFCRNFHIMENKGFPYRLIAKIWRYKQEKSIKKLDGFVVLTQHDADSWSKVRNATVIPNPCQLQPNKLSDCTSNKIISVGRLNEQKGFERLIEAWADIAQKHSDWEINIYGYGEEKLKLESLINEMNVKDSFHIYPPTMNIVDKYCESSIYVMSSRYEGFGMVLVEAMDCGLPCISFDCPYGPSDIIQEGENGFLVKNGDINTLSESIEHLIINSELRIKMGKNAKISVMKFNPENIMTLWVNLFKSLKP